MDFENYEKVLRQRQEAPKKLGIHSYLHEIAREVASYVNEPKMYGMWLGQTRRVGPGQMKANLTYMKSRGIKSPKYLMTICSNEKPASL